MGAGEGRRGFPLPLGVEYGEGLCLLPRKLFNFLNENGVSGRLF